MHRPAGYLCSPPDVAAGGYLCGRDSMRTTPLPAWSNRRCDRHEHRPTAVRYGFYPNPAPVQLPACHRHAPFLPPEHSHTALYTEDGVCLPFLIPSAPGY